MKCQKMHLNKESILVGKFVQIFIGENAENK